MEKFVFQTSRATGQRALFACWSCWLFCVLTMPVSITFNGTFESLALFVFANLALWLGLSVSGRVSRQQAEPLLYNSRDLGWILACLTAAGTLAIVAKLVDLVEYRDILTATSFEKARENLQVNGSNPFSTLYLGLSPAIMAGGILALPLLAGGRHRRTSVFALLLFCINPMLSFVYGGRSVLFLVAGLGVVTWLLVVPRISRRQIFAFAGLVTIVFFVTMVLFVGRSVQLTGTQVDYLASASDYTKLVPLSIDTIATMRDLPDLPRYLLYYAMSVGQYVIHGVFEFFYLVQAKSPDEPWMWGRYQFALYDQVLRQVPDSGAVADLENFNPTSGLFSTFWGPAYIDFGYLMIFYGFACGYAVGRVRRVLERGDLFALPLYVLLLLQVFLVPIVNGILMAASVLFNVGFLGIWLLSRLYLGKQRNGAQTVMYRSV
jgi:oligosaccharide repeat unit polymerase